ncbi:MAG: hypothetical protein IPH75_08065 [bacterium]|nr:hypothetical protein [bacterium]
MTRILAIDPCSREFGFAVMVSDRLINYGIKSLRRPDSKRTNVVMTEFSKLIDTSNPNLLVLVKNDYAQEIRRTWYERVVLQMEEIARKRDIPLFRINIGFIKQSLAGRHEASKWELANALIAFAPHLQARLRKRYTSNQQYVSHMFVAIACGRTALDLHQQGKLEMYAANDY